MSDEYRRNELVDIAGIAMDNVHDMGVTISDYAEAAVDAILASDAIQTARDEALCALAQQIAILRDNCMDDSKRGRCDEHKAISRAKAESYDDCMALIGDTLTGVNSQDALAGVGNYARQALKSKGSAS